MPLSARVRPLTAGEKGKHTPLSARVRPLTAGGKGKHTPLSARVRPLTAGGKRNRMPLSARERPLTAGAMGKHTRVQRDENRIIRTASTSPPVTADSCVLLILLSLA